MLKIRSTEKLASSNHNGLCDVQRIITSYRDNYRDGVKTSTEVTIRSRFFKEQEVELAVKDNSGSLTYDGNGDVITELVKERRYLIEESHQGTWRFSNSEIEQMEQLLADQLEGKSEDEKRLIAFIAQTKTASEDSSTGWQGMDLWIPDTENYVEVNKFSEPYTS